MKPYILSTTRKKVFIIHKTDFSEAAYKDFMPFRNIKRLRKIQQNSLRAENKRARRFFKKHIE